MPEVVENPEREQRITMEIIVDAYGPEEQAMGWYYYLQDTIAFPFEGICMTERAISPLRIGDRLKILVWRPRRNASMKCLWRPAGESESLRFLWIR